MPNEPAEVDKVFLGGGALLQLVLPPFGYEVRYGHECAGIVALAGTAQQVSDRR
jgi:hypothetical protein